MMPITDSQKSAQDWINNPNSGQGGYQNYVSSQINKYNDAVKSGNNDMVSRLQTDAGRVGYTLPSQSNSSGQFNTGNPQASMLGIDTGTIANSARDNINTQVQAFNQQLAQSQLANQAAVDSNNRYLAEQVKQFQQDKARDMDNATTFQNRRGGFYSGGLDYQQGQITNSYGKAQQALEQDIASRNAQIWGQNSQIAQQAAEKIALLQSQAPNVIAEKIQAEIDRQRGLMIQEAGLTGNYNGQRTLQGQQFDTGNEHWNTTRNDDNYWKGVGADQWSKSFESDNHWKGVGADQWNKSFNSDNYWKQDASDRAWNAQNWDQSETNPGNELKHLEVEKVKTELASIGKTKPITTEDAINVLNRSRFITEETTTNQFGQVTKTGKKTIDKPGMIQAIAALPLSGDDKQIEKQMDALFNYFGISEKDIKAVDDELRAARQSGN